VRAVQPDVRWRIVGGLVLLSALFALAWVALAFGYGLGTCGEDSDLSGSEYDRLCGVNGSGGSIARNMGIIAVCAGVSVAVLGAAAWHRRSLQPVTALAIVLLVLGVVMGTLG
jgi:hypothetical protein